MSASYPVGVAPCVRTVKTASGARAVQIVHSRHRGSRDIEHIGSAHTDADLEVLKAAARQRIAGGQGELDFRLPDSPPTGGPLPITSSRMGHLLDALGGAYDRLGFDRATGRPVDPAGGKWRARLATACAAHTGLGPATFLLYDVTTL